MLPPAGTLILNEFEVAVIDFTVPAGIVPVVPNCNADVSKSNLRASSVISNPPSSVKLTTPVPASTTSTLESPSSILSDAPPAPRIVPSKTSWSLALIKRIKSPSFALLRHTISSASPNLTSPTVAGFVAFDSKKPKLRRLFPFQSALDSLNS